MGSGLLIQGSRLRALGLVAKASLGGSRLMILLLDDFGNYPHLNPKPSTINPKP